MKIVLVLTGGAFIYFFSQSILYLFTTKKRVLAQRLKNIAYNPKNTIEDERNETLKQPLIERIVRPFLGQLGATFGKLTPGASIEQTRKRLQGAGNPDRLKPQEFLAFKYMITVMLMIFGIFMTAWGEMHLTNRFLMIITLGLLGWKLPDLYLYHRLIKRKKEIQCRLPDILDLLTVSVEAGLGFDAAISKVVEKSKDVLANEFSRVLKEIQMGKPRREAMRALANRVQVEDISAFVGAMIQADQLGVSIGNVLRLQSEAMRQKRKQRAEEAAMKAPVKMLLPMVLFIFPTIFIVLLGPAMIQVFETLMK